MGFIKTISFDGIRLWCLSNLLTIVIISGCSSAAAPCPFEGEPDSAPSAGCFTVKNDRLLLVQALNGKVSLPGGSSDPDEAAQCTAYRETWEETGLRLQPRERVAVFDTGFHLYRCERDGNSGEIDPPPRLEVRAAFYLRADQFGDYEWRFPDQAALLTEMLAADEAPQ